MRVKIVVVVLVAAMAAAPSAWMGPAQSTSQRPRVSPHEEHEFDVDGCHIVMNYGRPSKKGRVIWGALVPWGKWWMPGADESTLMTSSEAIVIDQLTVPAGQHTFYMLPDEKTSKFIISNETGQFHTQYHPTLDLGRVDFALKMVTEPVEQLTFTAEPRPGGGGLLKLTWDDREYSVNFSVKK